MPNPLPPMDERPPDPLKTFPFGPLREVNERCIELLVHAARSEARPPFSFVTPLREILRDSSPAIRRKAATRCYLLVDMSFADPDWWRTVPHRPDRTVRVRRWEDGFPRRIAVPLARSSLMLAWQGVRADMDVASALFGMHRKVAEVVNAMQLSDIDLLSERHFRRIKPRWADRPSIWRALLLSARAETPAAARDVNLHALRLLAEDACSAS